MAAEENLCCNSCGNRYNIHHLKTCKYMQGRKGRAKVLKWQCREGADLTKPPYRQLKTIARELKNQGKE